MVALNEGATTPPALSAGGDIGRPSGDPSKTAGRRTRPDSADRRAVSTPTSRARDRRRFALRGRRARGDGGAPPRRRQRGRARSAPRRSPACATTSADSSATGSEARRAAPALASPLTVITDAELELGRYASAARTAQRLVNWKPGLPAYARVSYYRELTGDPGRSRARDAVRRLGGRQPAERRLRARAARRPRARTAGASRAARAAYLDALRDVPSYPQALTGLARLERGARRPRRGRRAAAPLDRAPAADDVR